MNKKISVLIVLCIPLITIAFISIRYLISYAPTLGDQNVANLDNSQKETAVSDSEVSFKMYSQHAYWFYT